MGKNMSKKSSSKKKPSSFSKCNEAASKKIEEANRLKQEELEKKEKDDVIVMEALRKDSQRLRNKCNQLSKQFVSKQEQSKERTEHMEEWKELLNRLVVEDFDGLAKAEDNLKRAHERVARGNLPVGCKDIGRTLVVISTQLIGNCQKLCVMRMMVVLERITTNVASFWNTADYSSDEAQAQMLSVYDSIAGCLQSNVVGP